MRWTSFLFAFLAFAVFDSAWAEAGVVTLGTSTSVRDSGLLDVLQPAFERDTGYQLKSYTTGSGKAIQLAREGIIDVLLVHAPAAEREFIAQGYVGRRIPYMSNFFLIVGPSQDPAGVQGTSDAREAFRRIARSRSLFISRGDDSGNHQQEVGLWKAAGVDSAGSWYFEAGQGMEAVLRLAGQKSAYILIDDGTWLARRKSSPLRVLARDPERLGNTYALITMNARKQPRLNHRGAATLVGWLRSDKGKTLVRSMVIDGEPLFTLVSP